MQKYNGPAVNPIDLSTLGDMVDHASDRVARPRITVREVLAQALQNGLAGVGAGAIAWIGAYWLVVPGGDAIGLTVAVVTAGGLMIWRGTIDERMDRRTLKQIKTTADRIVTQARTEVAAERVKKEKAYNAIEDLERTMDQLQRDLDTERLIRKQLQERLQGQRGGTFIKPQRDPEPVEVRDARDIIERWYANRGYLSRQAAADLGWTQGRHRAASALLLDAHVIARNGQQMTFITRSIDEAQKLLSDHLVRLKAQVEPLPENTEEDYDDQ